MMTDNDIFKLCNDCPHLGYRFRKKLGTVWLCDKYDAFQKAATKKCLRARMDEFKLKEREACTPSTQSLAKLSAAPTEVYTA